MRVTKGYLRQVIKESIEEAVKDRSREYGGGQFSQSDIATGQEGENETVLNVKIKYTVDDTGRVEDCKVFDEAGNPVEMMGAAKKSLMSVCQQYYNEDTAESDRWSDAQAREDGGQGYMYEAEDKGPSTTAISFGHGGKYHGQIRRDGTGTFQDGNGNQISQEKAMTITGYREAMKRAAARGYGKDLYKNK
jgi:hypothetical protein